MRTIVVVDYDPAWPAAFERLRAAIWPAVRAAADAIEHVGSTAVPGLAAKPIVDLDIVVRSGAEVPAAIARLATRFTHDIDAYVGGKTDLLQRIMRAARAPMERT